jgi:dinuclear metal center YbgI/SA1388 family protein
VIVMADRDAIVAFLDDYLDIQAYPDHLPVGLQVPGAAEVSRVVSGVSASLELFRRAADADAQMLIVHHGLFWKSDPRRIGVRQKERLRCLFDHDLSLVAYHLALDAHPEVGNNALICRALELDHLRGFGTSGERTLGFVGSVEPSISPDRLIARVRATISSDPIAFLHGPERVRNVAVVSGAAAGMVDAAADAGADAFITGEPNEPAMARAQEAGIHFIAAGHHATEVFGPRALGELVSARFGVEHRFINVPNPV